MDQRAIGSDGLRFSLQPKHFGSERIRYRRHAAQISVPVEMHGGDACNGTGIEKGIERIDPGDLGALLQRRRDVVRRQDHIRAKHFCEGRIGFLGGRVGEDDVEGDHLRTRRAQALDELCMDVPRPGPALADLADGGLVDRHDHGTGLCRKRRGDD